MERLLRTIVLEHKNKRIQLSEIERTLKERGINLFADQSRQHKFIETVDTFIARGILEPLKGARPLQQYRGLPDRYTIHRDVIADAGAPLSPEYRNELFSLSPPISIDYYVTHGDEYLRDRNYILRINDLILRREECEVLTINERSYELFGDEKAIAMPDEASVKGALILKKLRLTLEDIRAKQVFEPFFWIEKDFSNLQRKTERTVLIVENKDTFWTLQQAVTDGVLAGVHLVIYGEGKAILKKFEYIETVGGVPDDRYRYFGDIDWEGISIYNRLRARYPEYDIRPATGLYTYILQKAGFAGARPLRRPQRAGNLFPFLDFFDEETGDAIRQIVTAERYLPQEVLNATDLSRFGDGRLTSAL
ncbi:Wadjet anti-phage system protein JetD domain-containing protein [Methanoculleus sp.]|uniref:Wadjet anti-phage system protein JetD domain-containing protein n=1 Tax=Methanoculleus sp. TaxID=90427 RepID=UPI002612EE57|nr:Wadjet anti-phage system protein JetD domain-containing protein [Methanoculleus sp.]MDI6720591.1 DUF2220 family protein [Methanomicrobiales archaeon]MDI6867715.1 DUF2220 family protein [Methanoculleus sp.]